MSVARIERNLREGRYAKRIGTSSAVYLSAVLEYLCAEVLDLSASECVGRKLINVRHLMLAIKNDAELEKLLKDVIIPGSGVLQNIHPSFLPKL